MIKPYLPPQLPLKDLAWVRFITLIGDAQAAVARFDSLLQAVPNPEILLAPLRTKEALLSSKIEGTVATLEEVFEFDANPDIKSDRRDDVMEVINYRQAMRRAIRELDTTPLSSRIIRDIHSVLMDGVRGMDKTPGEFRRGQNHIGTPGSALENAIYIPPEHQHINGLIANFEKYIHSSEKDVLVQLAIIHAQFELIHPFWDGNGRTGRILLPLFLYCKKVITSPNFYLSEYFEQDRDAYYSNLKGISKDNAWDNWIEYFLAAVNHQSIRNYEKLESILEYYTSMPDIVQNLTHSEYTHKIVNYLFSNPVFSSKQIQDNAEIPRPTTNRILQKLQNANIISVASIGKGSKPSYYLFGDLLRLVNK